MGPPLMKDVLRSVTVEPGELFVMIPGIISMEMLPVDNLALVLVRQTLKAVIKDVLAII